MPDTVKRQREATGAIHSAVSSSEAAALSTMAGAMAAGVAIAQQEHDAAGRLIQPPEAHEIATTKSGSPAQANAAGTTVAAASTEPAKSGPQAQPHEAQNAVSTAATEITHAAPAQPSQGSGSDVTPEILHSVAPAAASGPLEGAQALQPLTAGTFAEVTQPLIDGISALSQTLNNSLSALHALPTASSFVSPALEQLLSTTTQTLTQSAASLQNAVDGILPSIESALSSNMLASSSSDMLDTIVHSAAQIASQATGFAEFATADLAAAPAFAVHAATELLDSVPDVGPLNLGFAGLSYVDIAGLHDGGGMQAGNLLHGLV